jgi:hypothetical protein
MIQPALLHLYVPKDTGIQSFKIEINLKIAFINLLAKLLIFTNLIIYVKK